MNRQPCRTLTRNYILLFLSLFLINLLIFFSFINGYFPSKRVLLNKSEPLQEFSTHIFGSEYVKSIKENPFIYSIVNPPYEKIVVLLLDALRFDFILFDPEYEKQQKENKTENETKYFLNNMPKIHNLLKKEKRNSLLFRLDAEPPTVTTSRLKAILVGTFSSFLDINENFSPSSEVQDQLIEQLSLNNTTITAIGDDTIKYLTHGISKEYLYHSFDIFDFFSVDNQCRLRFRENFPLDDWGILYVHMLGIDHVGHIEGPNTKVMQDMIRSFDDFVEETIEHIRKDTRKGNTLLFVFGDHGQLDSGDHGGSSEDEVESGMLIYSLLPMISIDPEIQEDNVMLYDKNVPESIRKKANSDYTNNSSGYKKYHSLLNGMKGNAFDYTVKVTRQMNLLSTWALLKGFSIPFSNIGSVMMDLLPHAYIPVSKNLKKITNQDQTKELEQDPFPNQPKMFQEMLNFHYIAELNFANLWQMNRYFTTYSKKFKVLKNDTFYTIQQTWKEIEQEKTKFFKPNRFDHFLNAQDSTLQQEKKEYVEYINKMREQMNIMQSYFYELFIMEKSRFVFLCLFLTIFLIIMLNIFYYYTKTDYYCKLRVPSLYYFLTIVFLCVVPFNTINQKMYLFIFPCIHMVLLVTGFLSKREYKDWRYSFVYAFFMFLLNNKYFSIDQDIGFEEGTMKDKNKENTDDSESTQMDPINEKKEKRMKICEGSSFCIFSKIKSGSTDLWNFFNNNKSFLFILFWTCNEGSHFYLMKKRWYIQCMYIVSIIITSIQSKNKYSKEIFYRLFLILSVMGSIFALSLTESYYLFNVEKYILSECKLEVVLPIGCYLFVLGFLQWGIQETLNKSTKVQLLLFWTLQFILTFLYLKKNNQYLTLIVPHALYALTILFILFIITRKNSFIVTKLERNKKEEDLHDKKVQPNLQKKSIEENVDVPISFEKIRQIPLVLSIILLSCLQVFIIMYSTTNLSVLLLFFVSLWVSYSFLTVRTPINEQTNVEKTKNEKRNHDNECTQLGSQEKNGTDKNQRTHNSNNINNNNYYSICETQIPLEITNEYKESLKRSHKNERNNILNTFTMLEEKEIEQLQTYSALKNISLYFINDTNLFILASLLMQCSFFITGHMFLLNRLPLNAGYIGLNTYTWIISEFYIFNHIYLPFIFTILFIAYIQTSRSVEEMIAWNVYDVFTFLLNPLWNLLFKCFALFTFQFGMSLWTSYYLKLHIRLMDVFIPNFLFLTALNFVFATVGVFTILIVRRILLKK